QRDRRQRPPVVREVADQFGRQVLGFGSAAAVAGDQQSAAAAEGARPLGAPAVQSLGGQPVRQEGGCQTRQVRVDRRQSFRRDNVRGHATAPLGRREPVIAV